MARAGVQTRELSTRMLEMAHNGAEQMALRSNSRNLTNGGFEKQKRLLDGLPLQNLPKFPTSVVRELTF